MKKIFLIVLTLPFVSFAEGDPNLVFQSGGASSTALGTTAKPVCKNCIQTNLNLGGKKGKSTNAYQNGQGGEIDPVTGKVKSAE